LRHDYGLNVLAIGQSQQFDINPTPDRRLCQNDLIIVIGKIVDIDRLPLDRTRL
jgi:trk system potassium uptake protein